MKVNSFIIKLVVLIMFIIMGSSCLVGFTQTSLSTSYGKQKIQEIKSRNSSSDENLHILFLDSIFKNPPKKK